MPNAVTIQEAQTITPSSDTSPGVIAQRLQDYAEASHGAFAENTMRAVQSDTRVFSAWCADNGHKAGPPALPETVAAFVDAQAQVKAPATVSRYVSSIDHLHRAAGVLPVGPSNVVRLALRRMRREAAKAGRSAQRQAQPLRWAEIEAALEDMGESLIDLRDAALICLAFDTLARASEVVALRVRDVHPSGKGFVAHIGRSKTDQEGQGMVRSVSPVTYARVAAWVAAAHLDADSPLFIPLSPVSQSSAAIAPRDVSRIYKRRVGQAFSAHSTRVGAAVEMREHGIDTGEIAASGGWKGTAMPLRYAKEADALLSGAAKLASLQGRGENPR